MESPESSSPIITRAMAAGLAGRYCDNYKIVGWQRTALDLIGALPQAVAQTIIPRFQLPTVIGGFIIAVRSGYNHPANYVLMEPA